MTKNLTKTLNAIKQHHYTYGVTPTHKELSKSTGYCSSLISGYIKLLAMDNKIKLVPKRKRGIYLINNSN